MLLTVAQGQEQEIQSDRLCHVYERYHAKTDCLVSFELFETLVSYVSIKTLCA